MRYIPINDVLMDEFKRLRSSSNQNKRIFPFRNVRTAFEGACWRAGIEGLRFHDLRHTFATRLVERGVDLITVKELLGHSSVMVTERYTHSFKEQKRAAVEALSQSEKYKAGVLDDLLNLCETGERERKRRSVRTLFSVN
jgi:integrase